MKIDPNEVVISDRINPDEVEIVQTQKPKSGYGLTENPGIAEQFFGGAKHAWDRAAAGLQSAAGAVGLPTGESLQPLVQQGSQFVKETGPASTVGQVAGDVAMTAAPALKVFKGLNAARGLKTAIAGEAALNAGYGALTSDPGKRGEGAAWGAGASLGGQALGSALAAVRAGAKPTADALEFQTKMQQVHGGSPPPAQLTPGQLAPEKGWLRKTEEALADIPFVGAPLRSRHEDAMRGYQEWSRTLAKPPSAPGSSAATIADLKAAFNHSYEQVLKGKQIGDVSAIGMHELEKNMRREAGQFLKSQDPEQIKHGQYLLDKANEFRQQWRSLLSESDQSRLAGVDEAYASFVPIKEASKRQNATLVKPENYTPAMVLKRTRDIPNNAQAEFARQAEQSIGSIPSRPTTAGTIGLGGIGLGSLLLGQGPVAAGTAGAILGYGTKTGQKVARNLQRVLTADELAATLDALRRGAPGLTIQAGRGNRNGNDR